MAFFEEVKSKILVEWDKNCTVSSQDIFKNTMYASCLEKMWRVQTKSKSKVCVHGAKCTRAVSARKHCFDNWWCSIYIKAFSQGNATTSNNWRVGAKATHWIPTSVQLRVYRFLSHPHLQWGPRGASKGRFCWVLFYVWSWICSASHMAIAFEISALHWSQGRGGWWWLQALQKPVSQHNWAAWAVTVLAHPLGTGSSEELPFWRCPGSSRNKALKNWFHKCLSCLRPRQVNWTLCPATWVKHLAFPWLTRLEVSWWQGTVSSFYSHSLHPQVGFPKGDWLMGQRVGKKAESLTLGDLQQARSKETQLRRYTKDFSGISFNADSEVL